MLREPVVAGSFYPSTINSLRLAIEECFLSPFGIGSIPKIAKPFEGKVYPVNIMVPHAGYYYSGSFASFAYSKIAEIGFPKNFIIIGPNHTGMGREISVFNEGYWKTPLGNVKVNDNFANSIISLSEISSSDFSAHLREHSIEVQLPFLQYFSNDFNIVPITMGLQDHDSSKDLAKAIFNAGKEIDESYCVIASTDLTHFNNQEIANKEDNLILNHINNMDEVTLEKDILKYNLSICGYGPVISTIITSKLIGKNSCDILAYGTSGDITGDTSRVVGYGSGIFR